MLKMNEDKGLDYVNTKIYHDILFDEIYDLFYEYNIDVEKVFIAGLNDVVVKKWYGYNLDNDIIDNFFELLITDIENSDIRIDEVEYE